MSLAEDIQKSPECLSDFFEVTNRILRYYPEVVTTSVTTGNYVINKSQTAGATKFTRPLNKKLFLESVEDFSKEYGKFLLILKRIKEFKKNFTAKDRHIINSVSYTVLQSIGLGFDLLVNQNSARKLIGNRLEEYVRLIIQEIGLSCKKITLKIPYETDEGTKYYRCETDLIISPFKEVQSNSKKIDKNELVLSLKTTTKDRMPKIFIDKILMEKFVNHNVKVAGISINDIQRKEEDKVGSTFVSNLFMVYSEFLTELEGYYYMDIPQRAKEHPYNKRIFQFSDFIIDDIWEILNRVS